MKWAVMLLCSITGLFLMTSLGESAFKPKCENYVLPGCPRNFNPICGTDGETYANECLLCMMNREYNKDVKIARLSSCS